MAGKVTDPALLAKLNGTAGSAAPKGKKVTDPDVLHKLNGGTDDTVDDADLGDFEGNKIIPDSSELAGLPIPGTVSEAEARGETKTGQIPQSRRFGLGASDTLNPLPAVAAVGDTMFGNVPIAGPALRGARDQANAAIYGGTPAEARADINETVRQNPEAAVAGTIAGKTLPYVAAAGVAPVAGALGLEGSLGMRFLMGGLSSEAINLGDNLAHGEKPLEALGNATRDTLAGLPFYALGGRGARGATVKNAPTVAALKAEADGLYKAAEGSGLVIAAPSVDTFVNGVTSKAMKGGLDESLTPGAVAGVKRMQSMTGRNMTIQDAMTLRRVLGAAADGVDPKLANDRRLARDMIRDLDGFLDGVTKTGPGGARNMAVVAGDPVAAKTSLDAANKTWAQASKGGVIDEAVELAIANAGKNQGGASLEQPLRNEFGRLEREIIKGNPNGFTKGEQALIKDVARGGGWERIARYAGKFSPNGVISTSLGAMVGAGAGNVLGGGDPAMMALGAGAVLGLGAAGRSLASNMSKGKADYAGAVVRSAVPSLGSPGVSGQTLGGGALRALPAIAGRAVTTMTLSEYAKQGAAP